MGFDSLKGMARSRALKCGHFVVEFATPGIGHILKGGRLRLRPVRHRALGLRAARRSRARLRYFEAAQLPTIVRVPSKEYHHIARAADMGAEGIMLPMVNDAEEARRIVDSLKYVPDGMRGVALAIAHDRYTPGPTMEKLAAGERAHDALRPDRDQGRRGERRGGSRRWTGWTASGSGTSTCPARSGCRASSTTRRSRTRSAG